ncbi:MAG: DUF1634 domain-containing protein [Planctomycetes bacterium]|nr:DUF1634 domain-containing protein [Planctomycetota bacterium]
MTDNRQTRMDQRLEVIIGYTLRTGVITAAVIVLIGGVLYLVENSSGTPHYQTFQAAAEHSDTLSGIAQNIYALNSNGIIQLGLLVLIATPIVRVILSVVAFALERDLLYVVATVIVLAVLLYSLLGQGL